ncbi:hypothetical protein [Sessilibacter sp. MAH1]
MKFLGNNVPFFDVSAYLAVENFYVTSGRAALKIGRDSRVKSLKSKAQKNPWELLILVVLSQNLSVLIQELSVLSQKISQHG